MRYAILMEPTGTGFSAYVPDLPGCVAAGETPEETVNLIREADRLPPGRHAAARRVDLSASIDLRVRRGGANTRRRGHAELIPLDNLLFDRPELLQAEFTCDDARTGAGGSAHSSGDRDRQERRVVEGRYDLCHCRLGAIGCRPIGGPESRRQPPPAVFRLVA